ncbi:MAG: FIST N-terminal domain-containing protein [Candidatus Diapherotrites archaeon]
MGKDGIYAGLGFSDEQNPLQAAKQAATESVRGIKDPKLAIVFTSVHYGGNNLKKILGEIKKIVKAPVVGCTGAAILTPEVTSPHGIGIMTLAGQMDVGIGVGKKSRMHPIESGRQAAKAALENLGKSGYKNRCALIFPSGMKFPDLPGMKAMMKMGVSKLMFPALSKFMALKGTGPARYEEVLEGAALGTNKSMPIIGAGAFDDFKGKRNFQFLNEEVYQDSVVFAVISSDASIKISYKHGLKPTGKKMEITKAKGSLAFEINNKPAWQGFKELYEIPPELEDKWKSNPVAMTISEVPADRDENGKYWIAAPLCVIGDAILFARNVEEKTLHICRGTGEQILQAAKDVAVDATTGITPSFGLVFSPVPRVMTMMEKIDVERRYIKDVFNSTPFFGLYCCAAEVFLPAEKGKNAELLKCLNETIAIITFGK